MMTLRNVHLGLLTALLFPACVQDLELGDTDADAQTGSAGLEEVNAEAVRLEWSLQLDHDIRKVTRTQQGQLFACGYAMNTPVRVAACSTLSLDGEVLDTVSPSISGLYVAVSGGFLGGGVDEDGVIRVARYDDALDSIDSTHTVEPLGVGGLLDANEERILFEVVRETGGTELVVFDAETLAFVYAWRPSNDGLAAAELGSDGSVIALTSTDEGREVTRIDPDGLRLESIALEPAGPEAARYGHLSSEEDWVVIGGVGAQVDRSSLSRFLPSGELLWAESYSEQAFADYVVRQGDRIYVAGGEAGSGATATWFERRKLDGSVRWRVFGVSGEGTQDLIVLPDGVLTFSTSRIQRWSDDE